MANGEHVGNGFVKYIGGMYCDDWYEKMECSSCGSDAWDEVDMYGVCDMCNAIKDDDEEENVGFHKCNVCEKRATYSAMSFNGREYFLCNGHMEDYQYTTKDKERIA